MSTMRSIITASLRRLNAVSANSPPTADDVDVCLQAMNTLIDSMSNELLNIHTISPHRFLLNPLQQTYKLGPLLDDAGNPTGADWVVPRPMRIETAVLLVYPAVSTVCPPAPPPAGCNLVSSVQDVNTIDLWHFDEGVGSGSTTSTVSSDGTPVTVYFGDPGFSLQDGCCDTGFYLAGAGDEQSFANPATQDGGFGGTELILPDGFTLEFSIKNDGTTDPGLYDYAEVFRADFFTTGDGESLGIVRGFKVGQDLIITRDSNIETPWVTIPLPIDTCVAICMQGAWDGNVDIYADGNRVFTDSAAALFSFYFSTWNTGAFTVFGNEAGSGGTNLLIDEFRRSDLVRYAGATYDYTVATSGTGTETSTEDCVTTIGTTSSTMFYPLAKLTYRQYADLTARSIQSTWPTQVYDNGAYPVRELAFWPVPQNAYGVELWLWEPLATYATLDEELNLPPGYERYLILKLAMEVAPEFGKTVTDTLRATLAEAESVVKTLNQQQTRMAASVAGYAVGGRRPSWMSGAAVPWTQPTQV